MEDPVPDSSLSAALSSLDNPHHHSLLSDTAPSKQPPIVAGTIENGRLRQDSTEADADTPADADADADANTTVTVKQPTTSSSASRHASSAQTATAAGADADSNGYHGHHQVHRRRKAQFEVGDDSIQTEEDDNQVRDNNIHQQQQQQQQQGGPIDPETAGEETEGDDEQQQQHQALRGSQGHGSQHHATSTSSSTSASAAVPVAVAVAAASNADSRDENGARDESLAKTLIDSTLTCSIQDLSLNAGQDPTTTIAEEPQGEQEQESRQQDESNVRERIRSNQSQGEQSSARQSGSGQHQQEQQHQRTIDSEQTRDRQPRSQASYTNDRRGHALEKSKSNPPEVVSNGVGVGEGADSHTTHKSSASIHESQNLSESPKPRHRALSRTSPKSKRMSMLLDPSSSTTTLPSLTKVTTHTVMAIPPKQGAVTGDTSPSTVSSESSRAHVGQGGSGNLSASSPTFQPSPAVELVSKFLTSGAGAATSTSHATNDDDHHHPLTGSPGQIRRTPRSLHDKSNATSPQQRTGYTSKFYPVSPSQPQLSSSAPKSTTTSKHLIPPTIVTTSTSDENLPDMSSAGLATASATGPTTGPFSTGLGSAATGSAIAAAAVAQSNLAGGGSKTGTLSRTQQKLWLQRENLQDVDEDEMARRGRMQKEMDRIHREYKCVRMTLDPSMESLLRCLARSGKSPLQLQQQALAKASVSQSQSPHPSSQPQSPVLDQQQHRPLQHHRSLQQLNGHHQGQQMQQLQQQGHVGLGLHPSNQQNGPGGAGTIGRDSGKMTLRQIHQMQQLHHQQQQQQQQQGHHGQQHHQQQQHNYRQQHHG
ncbi:hypothetical protein BGX29_006068 [Mortierella sp. GBA35]|nr:hypothetical protein BGX29_006068 [Mortierella sp. GBA35]